MQQLVESYNQQQPLPLFLKSFFRANKKFGSRDRKIITQHIYNYYRLGRALPDLDFQHRLMIATYLTDNIIIDSDKGGAMQLVNSSNLDERIEEVKKSFTEFNISSVIPFEDELSEDLIANEFARSIFIRPKVFIRIRKGFEEKVKEELSNAQFKFEIINSNTFSFEPEIKITDTKSFENGWFEIQDLSSQLTGTFFESKPGELWWDCCAGAGGKSLLFKDKFPETHLLISDKRESILKNAGERLKKAGVKSFEIEALDIDELGTELQEVGLQEYKPLTEKKSGNIKWKASNCFDGIIVDAPCSGSGTWARSPENISFFKTKMIDEFQEQQINIINNAIKFLKTGGQLIYITCSAFKKENEDVIRHVLKSSGMKLIKQNLFAGYKDSADTMFAAQLVKVN